jgi:hypothetical protein
LLAHHEVTGKPYLQPRAAGLGLAGALLAELMLSGTLCLWRGGVAVADRPPPGDGLAGSVLSLVLSEHEQHGARDWLLFLARTAAEDVAGWSSRDTWPGPPRRSPSCGGSTSIPPQSSFDAAFSSDAP